MYSLYTVTGIFDFGKAFICIIMLPIIYKAEDIVKEIFGLESKNLVGAAAMGLIVVGQVQKAAKLAAKSAKMLEKAQAAKSVGRAKGIGGKNSASNITNSSTSNVANNNMAASAEVSKEKTKNKGIIRKAFGVANGKVAQTLAANAMGMALGYGMTGNYDTARAGKALQKGIRDAGKGIIGRVSLERNMELKKEDMLDAYERLKDGGYTDEQIYDLTEDILADDAKEVTNDLEKEYANAIRTLKDTKIAMSDKEGKEMQKEAIEYVLKYVQKHILK